MFFLTALLMGLAGGPHCVAMCGAACGGISCSSRAAALQFQTGRLCGYALAGALAALTAQSLVWVASYSASLRVLWTFFHLAVLSWGLLLLVYARQPAWASGVARAAWAQVKPLALSRGGAWVTGLLWALMPCGLLYSALLLASLSSHAWQGAGVMFLFGLGSSVSLLASPWLWQRLRFEWGTRVSGALLCLAAAWALWMDVGQRMALWCRV